MEGVPSCCPSVSRGVSAASPTIFFHGVIYVKDIRGEKGNNSIS